MSFTGVPMALTNESCDEKCARGAAAVFLALLAVSTLLSIFPRAAFATPAQPLLDLGYYMNTTNTTTAYNEGHADGAWDASHGNANRLAYLDFFGQNSSGTGTLTNTNLPFTNAQIESVAEQYASGYFGGTGSDLTSVLFLGVGTNNSLSDISTAGGTTWAGVVNDVNSWVVSHSINSQITIWGGNDIEAWYSNTSPSQITAWANGYDAHTSALYVNFGSADGCNQTGYTSGNGYVCSSRNGNANFTQHDYWNLSYGLPNAVSLPEIYSTGAAAEWTQLCLYGKNIQGKEIFFEGPLNNWYKDSTSLTATAAWNDFWNDLAATACSQTPSFAVGTHDE
jgi:hypothetical protein